MGHLIRFSFRFRNAVLLQDSWQYSHHTAATPRYLEESFTRGVRWTLRDHPELEHGHVDAQESARRDAARVGDCGEGFGGHNAGLNLFLILPEGCVVSIRLRDYRTLSCGFIRGKSPTVYLFHLHGFLSNFREGTCGRRGSRERPA